MIWEQSYFFNILKQILDNIFGHGCDFFRTFGNIIVFLNAALSISREEKHFELEGFHDICDFFLAVLHAGGKAIGIISTLIVAVFEGEVKLHISSRFDCL